MQKIAGESHNCMIEYLHEKDLPCLLSLQGKNIKGLPHKNVKSISFTVVS